MAQIAFDTLEYSNRLQAGGIPREHAEAIVQANVKALKDLVEMQQLVTKNDLALAKNELEAQITETRNNLEAQITETRSNLEARIVETRNTLEMKLADSKHELLKWIIGLAAAQIALMAAISGIVIAVLKN